jgi:formylglycine-generating enzyme required for sulfatase activity
VSATAWRPRSIAVGVVLLATAATVAAGVALRGDDEGARCGPGFVAQGSRCAVATRDAGAEGGSCPPPLVPSPLGCDAPDVRVLVPEATLALGPSDWEAEGRVSPRTVHTTAFRIDAFEVTVGRWSRAPPSRGGPSGDAARAASGMTRDEAASFCAEQAPGGRLPTEDEWIAAAVAGASPVARYPWGETGAVCRRAAWGLGAGPCARGADGPDTVGSHPTGDSALGLHDLAGNVAEWVAGRPGAKGGSWASDLAADLRIWARLDLSADARDARVGFRCVYPP